MHFFFIFLNLQILQNFINVTGGKFATGINNTSGAGGKSCRPVSMIWWCTLICEYLHDCKKKFEMTLLLFSGDWEKKIHEKILKQKSCDTVPSKYPFLLKHF